MNTIIGVLIATLTAVGVILYEKLVHNFSFLSTRFLVIVEVLIVACIAACWTPANFSEDWTKLCSHWKYSAWMIGLVATSIAVTFLWFYVTIRQGAMVGAIYEVKYVVLLAILYALMGDRPFTLNMGLGVALAISSLYFISK